MIPFPYGGTLRADGVYDVDPMRFGVIGNGTADDTPALWKASAHAAGAVATGKCKHARVVLPDGRYYIPQVFNVYGRERVAIVGGGDATVFVTAPNNYGINVDNLDTVNAKRAIELRSFKVTSAVGVQGTEEQISGRSVVRMSNSAGGAVSNSMIRGVTVDRVMVTAFGVDGGSGNSVTQCRGDRIGEHAVYGQNASLFVIQHNVFRGCGWGGWNAQGVELTANGVHTVVNTVKCANNVAGASVKDNEMVQSRTNCTAMNSHIGNTGCRFEGNRITSLVTGGTCYMGGAGDEFIGNTVTTAAGYAGPIIDVLASATGTLIKENVFSGNTANDVIVIRSPASGGTVSENQFGTGRAGFAVAFAAAGSTGWTITGNDMSGGHGIDLTGNTITSTPVNTFGEGFITIRP